MPKDKGYIDKVLEKAGDFMFGKGTGVSVGEGAREIKQHRSRIDEINRELDNTASGDTEHTKKIFED
jgi:hypothetical protein